MKSIHNSFKRAILSASVGNYLEGKKFEINSQLLGLGIAGKIRW